MNDGKPKQFILYKDERGEWRWRLRAQGNNKSIAVSGEGYQNRNDALHAVRLVANVAPGTGVWDAEAQQWIP